MKSTKIIRGLGTENKELKVAERKVVDLEKENISVFSNNFFKINPTNSGILASLAHFSF